MIPCIRCGLCCLVEFCAKGKSKDKQNRKCIYLIENQDDTTSCKLILEGKMPSKYVQLNQGCAYREQFPLQYEANKVYWQEKRKLSVDED